MKKDKLTLPKIIGILVIAIVPMIMLLGSGWICDIEYQSARSKLDSATITKYSVYEIIYIDKFGKVKATTNEKEYRAAVQSFY